jgi:hypothetical protein
MADMDTVRIREAGISHLKTRDSPDEFRTFRGRVHAMQIPRVIALLENWAAERAASRQRQGQSKTQRTDEQLPTS